MHTEPWKERDIKSILMQVNSNSELPLLPGQTVPNRIVVAFVAELVL